MRGWNRGALASLAMGAMLTLGGCASAPPQVVDTQPAGQQAVSIASSHVGVPYRFGGASPRQGFDCSGLVHYSYQQVGIGVPRTVAEQLEQSRRVQRSAAQPGDLLFFRIEGKPSHVGIYAGGGRFVHAPSGGKTVTMGTLSSPYWASRLVQVGRVAD